MLISNKFLGDAEALSARIIHWTWSIQFLMINGCQTLLCLKRTNKYIEALAFELETNLGLYVFTKFSRSSDSHRCLRISVLVIFLPWRHHWLALGQGSTVVLLTSNVLIIPWQEIIQPKISTMYKLKDPGIEYSLSTASPMQWFYFTNEDI